MKTKNIFISSQCIADEYIKKYDYPYNVLPNIKHIIMNIGNFLDDNYQKIGEDIWISKKANVSSGAEIMGPCIIDDNASIRHNAFIRGNVIIGKNCVLGNSCEIKNSILYDGVEAAHFNYIGDSILGFKVHLGAGVILSNLRSDKQNIKIKFNSEIIDTGIRKVGSFLGDNVEIACNCVLNPGTIVYHDSIIYPLTSVRGVILENVIVKSLDNIVKKNN